MSKKEKVELKPEHRALMDDLAQVYASHVGETHPIAQIAILAAFCADMIVKTRLHYLVREEPEHERDVEETFRVNLDHALVSAGKSLTPEFVAENKKLVDRERNKIRAKRASIIRAMSPEQLEHARRTGTDVDKILEEAQGLEEIKVPDGLMPTADNLDPVGVDDEDDLQVVEFFMDENGIPVQHGGKATPDVVRDAIAKMLGVDPNMIQKIKGEGSG